MVSFVGVDIRIVVRMWVEDIYWIKIFFILCVFKIWDFMLFKKYMYMYYNGIVFNIC